MAAGEHSNLRNQDAQQNPLAVTEHDARCMQTNGERMKAIIIIIGGIGSRLFPVGKSVNKAMIPILNRPVVAYAIG
ncbi:sugar phosphate nucleotidyltransferase [Actinoplanes sp. ATCC 53533]|uniref:sugar phosphate nucleotidyltransferase n=1 Tax=Actinoplanes sp. ATCC 53533 TaxID=1288362 RepID=UPI000F789210|nr:sugar phosphate nucleotidyltransferase [Actinoplanes sp. ATCC 53533]